MTHRTLIKGLHLQTSVPQTRGSERMLEFVFYLLGCRFGIFPWMCHWTLFASWFSVVLTVVAMEYTHFGPWRAIVPVPIVKTDWWAILYGKLRSRVQPFVSRLTQSRDAHEIVEGVWLGSISAAANKDFLQKELRVSHVVTAIIGVDPLYEQDFRYHLVPIRDSPEVDILSHLDRSIEFIDAAHTGGGTVFVHCMAGKSRSATILAAYLIHKNDWTVDEALSHLKVKRSIVEPNHGFVKQLRNWHATRSQPKLLLNKKDEL